MAEEQCDIDPVQDLELIGQRELIHPLDLACCNIVYLHQRLNEFERKQSLVAHRFDTWPGRVQIDLQREMDAWQQRNPGASVKAITLGICDGACTVAVHWR